MEFLPVVICSCLDEIQLQQLAGDHVRQLVSESEHGAIGRHVRAGHHAVTDAVLLQEFVEVALLVVLTFADVRRNVHVPVRLPDVAGKTLPAKVILKSNTTQCSCYRLRRVTIATLSNALRVPEYIDNI